MINLTYGGQFNEDDLVDHIRQSGRNYIIQGQTACSQADHPKPSSLDFWLRQFGGNNDTKQADNEVIGSLVATGLFKVSNNLECPDSGKSCKGIVLVGQEPNK